MRTHTTLVLTWTAFALLLAGCNASTESDERILIVPDAGPSDTGRQDERDTSSDSSAPDPDTSSNPCGQGREPQAETCNGEDDDCDGRVDEDIAPQPCGTNKGACSTGTRQCENGRWGPCTGGTRRSPEACDGEGRDEDCDGTIDEGCDCDDGEARSCGTYTGVCEKGTMVCENGSFGECEGERTGSTERCNGKDDDCDGQTDENVTRSCGTSTGACTKGTASCNDGTWGSCTGNTAPTEEKCNGVDDDCDGHTDENLTRSCGTSTGVCQTGTQTCSGASWGSCMGEKGPSAETCNGKDDDCNGRADDGLTRNCPLQKGVCAGSTQSCNSGAWNPCNASTYGSDYEVRERSSNDGKDNDCDGEIDETEYRERITAGSDHVCAVKTNGTLRCWGSSLYSQIGNTSASSPNSTPVKVENINTSRGIEAGSQHNCTALTSGDVYCWGQGDDGELGNGKQSYGGNRYETSTPVRVKNISTGIEAVAGLGHSCALLRNGEVRCWGLGEFGQLGDGNSQFDHNSDTPVKVKNLSNAVDLSAHTFHTCAVTRPGDVYCWGSGYESHGVESSTPEKQKVPGTALQVVTGDHHTCALRNDGEIYCWGDGEDGTLGDGNLADHTAYQPVRVKNISNAVDIAAGAHHTCGVLASGEIRCWGHGGAGRLGDGSTSDRATPVKVSGISSAVDLGVGGAHGCAILRNDDVHCWGKNDEGQLGDGTTNDSSTPVKSNF